KKKKNLSGVSLNMPPEFQLSIIKKAFPKKESIGIFFSGEGNGKLLKYYEDVALKYNMKIVGFPLKSEKEIPMILNSMKFQPDILMFIPDRIVIKEKLINYIIKACIIKKIPVIGFNRWFCKNGAVLSFYLDYGDIGIQTGKLSKRLFKTKSIQSVVEPPKRIRILINIKVADKFNFELSEYIKKSADVF
ncbi:MAG: ABC transporter substrate binding protein, partial [Thermodesulfobacteriota bacterium]|nr:ABC transporter substrate binding protein [Thermodesulfobacteriota bacterium]